MGDDTPTMQQSEPELHPPELPGPADYHNSQDTAACAVEETDTPPDPAATTPEGMEDEDEWLQIPADDTLGMAVPMQPHSPDNTHAAPEEDDTQPGLDPDDYEVEEDGEWSDASDEDPDKLVDLPEEEYQSASSQPDRGNPRGAKPPGYLGAQHFLGFNAMNSRLPRSPYRMRRIASSLQAFSQQVTTRETARGTLSLVTHPRLQAVRAPVMYHNNKGKPFHNHTRPVGSKTHTQAARDHENRMNNNPYESRQHQQLRDEQPSSTAREKPRHETSRPPQDAMGDKALSQAMQDHEDRMNNNPYESSRHDSQGRDTSSASSTTPQDPLRAHQGTTTTATTSSCSTTRTRQL